MVFYPWPAGVNSAVLDAALGIAMNYLEGTGQAELYEEVERCVATAILNAWRAGVSHPIRLGNVGIAAIERGDWKNGSKLVPFARKNPR